MKPAKVLLAVGMVVLVFSIRDVEAQPLEPLVQPMVDSESAGVPPGMIPWQEPWCDECSSPCPRAPQCYPRIPLRQQFACQKRGFYPRTTIFSEIFCDVMRGCECLKDRVSGRCLPYQVEYEPVDGGYYYTESYDTASNRQQGQPVRNATRHFAPKRTAFGALGRLSNLPSLREVPEMVRTALGDPPRRKYTVRRASVETALKPVPAPVIELDEVPRPTYRSPR